MTLFTATLVQDSALSVSGLDRESSADQPFTLVGGVPTLVGRGLKGAAVAMAKRFFDRLPRAVTDDIKNKALRRSAWEFADATALGTPQLRAGVGIRQKTGARAGGILYDREVIPAGTTWKLDIRVDWSHIPHHVREEEGPEAEGILGYVLAAHWERGRCWLGSGAARGLGWCHVENVQVHRLDAASYELWVESGRTQLPPALQKVPVVSPTRSWSFRTLDVSISFGVYKPERDEPAWGLDMLAIGAHDSERTVQRMGDGSWAKPVWVTNDSAPLPPDHDSSILTDRAIVMESGRPLLPGSSVRGPLRHAFSRAQRALGREIEDPHLVRGQVKDDDLAGVAFGSVKQSSRILVRDARAEAGWSAAKLHMHAEDEFSAGSYGKAKRDAVRVLQGAFPLRFVIEGATPDEVAPLVDLVDRQVALGSLGHLPVGGHKTRGAGWGRWQPSPWVIEDIRKERDWEPPTESVPEKRVTRDAGSGFIARPEDSDVFLRTRNGELDVGVLTMSHAVPLAKAALGSRELVAWWCEPTIDLSLVTAPATFGRDWPSNESLQVDEVAFYSERAVWRAARTSNGSRFVWIEEVSSGDAAAIAAKAIHTPARLHGFARFSAANTGRGSVLLREWHVRGNVLGFTVCEEQL